MRKHNHALLLVLAAFAALTFGCVTVKNATEGPKQDAQPQTEKPKDANGFTVGETAVPATPGDARPKHQAGEGYTVEETAVPK